MTPREFLQSCPPFDRVSASALDSLEATLEVRFAPPGEALFRRSDAETRELMEKDGADVIGDFAAACRAELTALR